MSGIALWTQLVSAGLVASMLARLVFLCLRDGFAEVWDSLGLELDLRAFRLLLSGLAASGLAVLGIFAVEIFFGQIRIEGMGLRPGQLRYWLALILAGALYEEVVYRVLCANAVLALLRSPAAAALAAGILFGLTHAGNPGASWLSIVGNSMGGILYCWAYFGARSIWLPLGLHIGWNAIQGPVLGFPVSGLSMACLVEQSAPDVSLWTGGSYGPEGGLTGLFFRCCLLLAIVLLLKRRSPVIEMPPYLG